MYCGEMYGLGIIKNQDTVYQGEFKNGVYDGFGILIQENQTYEGFFQEGNRHGIGSFNSDQKGNFIDDNFSEVLLEITVDKII